MADQDQFTCKRCNLQITEDDLYTLDQDKQPIHTGCFIPDVTRAFEGLYKSGQSVCFRCKLPIRKGTLHVKAKNGFKSHLGCTWSAIGEALGDEPLGFGN